MDLGVRAMASGPKYAEVLSGLYWIMESVVREAVISSQTRAFLRETAINEFNAAAEHITKAAGALALMDSYTKKDTTND